MTPLRVSRIVLYVVLVAVGGVTVAFLAAPSSLTAGLFFAGGFTLGVAASLRGLPLSIIPTSARRPEIRARRRTILIDLGISLAALAITVIAYFGIQSLSTPIVDYWYFFILLVVVVNAVMFWLGLAASSLVLLPLIALVGRIVRPTPAAVIYPPPVVAAAVPVPAPHPAAAATSYLAPASAPAPTAAPAPASGEPQG